MANSASQVEHCPFAGGDQHKSAADHRRLQANDPRLLILGQATATFGFNPACHAHVKRLSSTERSAACAEAIPAGRGSGLRFGDATLVVRLRRLAAPLPMRDTTPAATMRRLAANPATEKQSS
ncbi:hypothetical protein BH10PSE14_BH10PSE14_22670 [soil metagenome]